MGEWRTQLLGFMSGGEELWKRIFRMRLRAKGRGGFDSLMMRCPIFKFVCEGVDRLKRERMDETKVHLPKRV